MIIFVNMIYIFITLVSSSTACDCSCHKPIWHPIWHGFRTHSTHCEAVWGSSQYSCPNVGDAWRPIASGRQTCNVVGAGGCCNRKCCNGSGPNPISLISAGKPATSSPLYNNGGTWPASNALQDFGNLGYECAWANRASANPGFVAIQGAPAGSTIFWQVDLQRIFEVTSIRLRGFDLPNYSNNVQFSVCSDANGLACNTCGGLINEPANEWKEVTCNSLQGRYVRLTQQTIDTRNWFFCRVAVYGWEVGTSSPTKNPTSFPTRNPTSHPTKNPTSSPTRNPTNIPTRTPTSNPTKSPTHTPTSNPTKNPTNTPTLSPSPLPTAKAFMMKINGFHGSPESSLSQSVFAQERVGVKKIDFDVQSIKMPKDSTKED